MMLVSIMEKIRDKLAADAAITEYCATNFSKLHTVFLGANPQDEPKREDVPCLVISMVEPSERDDQKSAWKIQIRIGIEDDTIVVEENKKTYRGFIRVHDISEMVENAMISSPLKANTATESILNEIFPLFTAKTTVSIEKNTPMRGVTK